MTRADLAMLRGVADHEGAILSSGSLPEPAARLFEADEFLALVQKTALHYQASGCCVALESPRGMCIKARLGITLRDLPYPCMCHHHIRRDLPIIIGDTASCDRVKEDAMVAGPPFARFYVGTPLVMPGEKCIGTLCLFDAKPRPGFGLKDCEVLTETAQKVIELFRRIGSGQPLWQMTMGSLPDISGPVSDGSFKKCSPTLGELSEFIPSDTEELDMLPEETEEATVQS
eukprot:gb/GFBE01005826.1/.p1 GENE.gb/GFBE01005826.1/~~gb/GFBE01005826.1/.p1  ORF type:complete len:230 (+),score=35.74 gb/GFBE01005826.1/:1-690(+)